MTDRRQAFLASLDHPAPPADLSGLTLAVWHGLRGDWQAAHDIAEADNSKDGAWVHAWLHRIEGDLANAGYWYRLAGQPRAADSTRLEGERIAASLLTR